MELIDLGGRVKDHPHMGRGASDLASGHAVTADTAWSLSQVLLATGGRFISGSPRARFRAISTDSRTIEAGDLFVALNGENHDGLAYVHEAVRKGAAGVMVAQLPAASPSVPLILVADTMKALGDLAAYRRAQLANLTVLAITGSSGKTTVKEMVAAILGRHKKILKTKGNFNNLVGLPLSLLPANRQHQVAVLEMGMNRPGEIARLAEIADPDIACINNIQEAHLAGFGGIEGVARAKGELFAGVKSWATLVVNYDDKRVRALARRCGQKQISFGRHRQALVRATHIHNRGAAGMSFTLHIGAEKSRVNLQALGQHNVVNGLAAAAMAYAAGCRLPAIVNGLSEYSGFDKRLQVEQLANGLNVVNDTYNANPASMRAALETVAVMARGHLRVAVLGDMLELGEQSETAHAEIGCAVVRLGYDFLFAVGEFAADLAAGARCEGMAATRVRTFTDKEAMLAALETSIGRGEFGSGDWLLAKGSRGMRMETVITALRRAVGGDEA